jgi:SnoaL-like domain
MNEKILPQPVTQFFRAMQAGATSEAEMMALFAERAEYSEPFSGQMLNHVGREAIRQTFLQGWRHPLPDMRLEIERFDLSQTGVRVDWTCHSPALPGGKGQGTNVFTLDAGQIVRLVTTLR